LADEVKERYVGGELSTYEEKNDYRILAGKPEERDLYGMKVLIFTFGMW
jgi:hypothetical protein